MPINSLSKDDQKELMWRWNEDKSLQLVYRTFENYVRVVTNNKELLHGG